MLDRSTGQPLFAPTFVKSVGGVRVGFIGVVTRSTPGIVVPSGVAGVRFVAEARALNEQAKALQAEGVQAIVAVVHEGGDADGGINDCANPRGAIFEIERELDAAIDVVLSAHTHQGYNCTIDGRPVIQGASFGRLVSVVDIAIDRTTGDVVRAQTRARNVPVVNGAEGDPRSPPTSRPCPPDPAVAAIVAAYRDAAAPLANRPVGRISAPFERRPGAGGDHALGRLIADAQLAATRGNGAEVAFTNPGGVRASLHASGPRRHGDVRRRLFDATLRQQPRDDDAHRRAAEDCCSSSSGAWPGRSACGSCSRRRGSPTNGTAAARTAAASRACASTAGRSTPRTTCA